MLNSKVITLSLILSFTTALGFPSVNESVTNIYHPPAALSASYDISNKADNVINNLANIKEEKTDLSEKKLPDTLVRFINISVELHGNKLYTLSPEESTDYLNTKEVILKDHWYSSKSSLSEYNQKLKKLKKMQKLASYISDQYNVPLNRAEKIVYTTFVEADKKNLEPELVLSIIGVESTFNPTVKSSAGAVGLTQVMAHIHKVKVGELRKENMDIWSIQGNIKVGTQILKEYMDLAGGNLKKALQMYNGSSKDRTFKYSNKILTKMNVYTKVSAT